MNINIELVVLAVLYVLVDVLWLYFADVLLALVPRRVRESKVVTVLLKLVVFVVVALFGLGIYAHFFA